MGKHVTEEQIALCVDAIMLDTQAQLPESILAHVGECFECKMEVMETLWLMKLNAVYQGNDEHPYFGRLQSKIGIRNSDRRAHY